jgi:oligoribonuclease NrnB/cAMP/cGMP phosphodiesterase (DHH superfamily)
MERVRVIIAHGDCDGIACAAIALRRFPDSKIVFAEPYNIHERIPNEIPVLILDLPYVSDGNNIYVIDHHPDLAPSCSYLMKSWREADEYLVNLGLAGDRSSISNLEIMEDAELLNDAIHLKPNDDSFKEYITHQLSKGIRIRDIPEVIGRAEEYRGKLRKVLNEAFKRVEDRGDYIIVAYPDIPNGFAGKIATELSKKFSNTFLIWRRAERTIVTMRTSTFNSIDICNKLKQVDQKHILGGGHRKAASYSTRLSLKETISLLMKILEKSSSTFPTNQ